LSTNRLEYLAVLFGVSTFAGYLWGLCYVAQHFETFVFSILLGYLTGFVASLYFSKNFRIFYPFTAFFATLWGFILAKYIIYAFLHLENYVTDIESNRAWMSFLIMIKLEDFSGFWNQIGSQLTDLDVLWIIIAIIFSVIYGSRVRSHKRKIYLLKKQFSDWKKERKARKSEA